MKKIMKQNTNIYIFRYVEKNSETQNLYVCLPFYYFVEE